ncbi:MAG TPA: PepSY domain-containing protein [Planctomycetaceae bacterium]|nr:PepSY domain-containing protein [Planctomycetaceae bacterium]
MFRRVFAASRWVHRYLGLLLFLYLAMQGVTGVLLNHPMLISGFSVPRWMVPSSYRIANWNRGSLRTVVFSEHDPSLGFLAGTEGVWKTTDGGVTFQSMASGYPRSRAERRTNHILLLEDVAPARLLAATRNGLYACSLEDEAWQRVPLGEGVENVRKILRIEDRVVVFTDSHAYESTPVTGAGSLSFRPVHLARKRSGQEEGIRLVKLMFGLHSGEIWGLPGRLLIDVVGVGLVFLSVSGIYMWYFPWARRRSSRGPGQKRQEGVTIRPRLYWWLYKYHLYVGVWTMIFLVVIAGTALFMPPSPLVSLVLRTKIPRQYWPGPLPSDPWHENIGNAAYDPARKEILIEVRGALWRGPADFSGPFAKDESRLPVGAMGTNVMEVGNDGGLLIGSFSGLYECRPDGGPPIDLSTGKPRDPGESRGPFGRWRVAGYFETPAGERFVATHNEGLVAIGDAQPGERFQMPDEMVEGYRMPLWNFLFEVHNGRIVRDWIGSSYFLISVLGALSLLAISFTGLYDWAHRKLAARGRKAGSAAAASTAEVEPAPESHTIESADSVERITMVSPAGERR